MYFKLLKISSIFCRIAADGEKNSFEKFIQEMNLNQNIVDFLKEIPNDKRGFYIAAIRKNPKIELEELQNIELKKETDLFPIEKTTINSVPQGMRNWAKEWLVKLRKGKEVSNSNIKAITDFIINAGRFKEVSQIEEALKQTKVEGKTTKFIINPSLAFYIFFAFELNSNQITDWYDSVQPNIGSYTPEQALEASNKWHEEVANRGINKFYEEGPENIVYGPEWQNPEWNGWTIRKITSENDLQVEGFKMKHCVGDYCDVVDSGDSTIYSLRDPSNNPHVTMEASRNSYNFQQIMGKSNSDPSPEYKEMVKEWFQYLKSEGKNVKNIYNFINVEHISDDWNEAKNNIEELKKDDEYGLETKLYDIPAEDFYYKFYNLALHEKEYNKIAINEIAEELIKIFHEKDKKLLFELENNSIDIVQFVEEHNFRNNFDSKKWYWRRNSGISAVITNNQYALPKLFNIKNIENMTSSVLFLYFLIKNIYKIQKQDPIPIKDWMQEDTWNYFDKWNDHFNANITN